MLSPDGVTSTWLPGCPDTFRIDVDLATDLVSSLHGFTSWRGRTRGYEKSSALPVFGRPGPRSLAIDAIYSHFLGIRCVVIKSPARLHTSRWQQNLVKLVKLTKSGAASAENGVRSAYPCTRVHGDKVTGRLGTPATITLTCTTSKNLLLLSRTEVLAHAQSLVPCGKY